MARRVCANCGQEKDVSGGRVCPKDHFICSSCVYGGFFGPTRESCPLCHERLR